MGVGKVAPAPEISVACTALTNATAAVAATSIRRAFKKLMVPLLMTLLEFCFGRERSQRSAIRTALDDRIITLP
jgi:hypothetical protein